MCQVILAVICVGGVIYINKVAPQKFLALTLMPCFAVLLALPIKLKCLLPIEDVIDNGKVPQMEKFVQKGQEVAQNLTQMVESTSGIGRIAVPYSNHLSCIQKLF